jgi:hypothetical protein
LSHIKLVFFLWIDTRLQFGKDFPYSA